MLLAELTVSFVGDGIGDALKLRKETEPKRRKLTKIAPEWGCTKLHRCRCMGGKSAKRLHREEQPKVLAFCNLASFGELHTVGEGGARASGCTNAILEVAILAVRG